MNMKCFVVALAYVLILASNVSGGSDSLPLTESSTGYKTPASAELGGISLAVTEKPADVTGTPDNSQITMSSERWKISLNLSKVSGYTLYEIGGVVVVDDVFQILHFPISQLKFPLNFYSLGLRAEIPVGSRYTLFFEGSKDISNNRGKMEDSDYLPGRRIFVFSESDTEIDAMMLDFGVNFNLLHNSSYSLSLGLGYRLEDFDYRVKNLDQWYPLRPELGHTKIPGLVGAYDVTYHIPYVSARLQVAAGFFFKVGFFLDLSPLIIVKDMDDHMLREILSHGKTDGKSYRGGMTLSHTDPSGIFVDFRAYRSHSVADGTDTSIVYGGENVGDTWKIDHKNKRTDSVLSLLVGIIF